MRLQKMNVPILCLLLSIFTIAVRGQRPAGAAGDGFGAVFIVAMDGSDEGSGTAEQPFASLERARDAIREMKAARGDLPPGGVAVYLRGGVHQREGTFALTAEDSGSADAPIVYASMPGELASLFGGKFLQREWFSEVSDPGILQRIISEEARAGLLQCNLKAHGISDYGALSRRGFHKADLHKTPPPELYVDGERMTRARWPNPDDHYPEFLRGVQKERHGVVGRAGIVDKGPAMSDTDFLERGGTISYAFDRPELWKETGDIWLDGVFTWSWQWSYNQVASIDTDKKQITLRYGEVSGIEDKYSFDYFFFENVLEEIDQPGEYYLDRATGILYLLPPPSFEQDDVPITFSWLTTAMVSLENASHITIRNLTFDHGRNAGIVCQGGRSVLIEHCELRNLSRGGISLSGYEHGARACHVHNVGGSGIGVGGGDLETLSPGKSFIEDCDIHHFAWYDKVYKPAISLGYRSVGNRASHNRIQHGPHVAMVVYGNDHLIEYNDIGYVVEDFTDMGAIYANLGTRPLERGTTVRRNYFHHIGQDHHLQNGVYPDNMTMGWRIEENVFYRIGAPGQAANCRAINLNSAAHVTCRHNIFIDCTIPCMLSSHAGRYNFEQHMKAWQALFSDIDLADMPHARKYPELLDFFEEERQFPDTCRFEKNLIYNPSVPLLRYYGRQQLPMKGGALDEPGALQIEGNWVAETDPGFVSAENKNFTLTPEATVFEHIPDFPSIPFQEIGPRTATGPQR